MTFIYETPANAPRIVKYGVFTRNGMLFFSTYIKSNYCTITSTDVWPPSLLEWSKSIWNNWKNRKLVKEYRGKNRLSLSLYRLFYRVAVKL